MTVIRLIVTLGASLWSTALLGWAALLWLTIFTTVFPSRVRGLPFLCWWHWRVMSWACWFVIPALTYDFLYRSGWERPFCIFLDTFTWCAIRTFKPPKPPRRRRKKSELPTKLREAFARVVVRPIPSPV